MANNSHAEAECKICLILIASLIIMQKAQIFVFYAERFCITGAMIVHP